MKTMQKIATMIVAAVIVTVFLLGNAAQAQQAKAKPWPVPDKDKTMKAPGKPDLATGKEMWAKHCKSCHGTKGLGDGPKSASLKTLVPSFADKKFKAQADGDIYYQTIVGRDEMPNFEKKIIDEADRWAVVNYIKGL